MSDTLETRNGESVTIDSVIEALERAPDKAEILQALRDLRRDKVKAALGDTVKAARFDLEQVFADFLADGEKSENTRTTYQRECRRLFSWVERQGIHLLQMRRAEVNRFKEWLRSRYADNTVRLTLAAGSSFFSYLEAEQYVERSPFSHITYPRKQYKKAVQTDQGSPVPVMNAAENASIFAELERRSQADAATIGEKQARNGARRLLPIVHFLSTYGLRVGDVLTVRIEKGNRFSYRGKGGRITSRELLPETAAFLSGKREPFAGIGKSTVQQGIKRLTAELVRRGGIRHAYSAHDFRHYFAVELYREVGDVYAVKEALGHATVSVTEVYLASLGLSDA